MSDPDIKKPILERSEVDLMYCSNCNKHVTVIVDHKNGLYAYLLCAILTFTGLFCFFWIPLTFKCSKDRQYICSNCNKIICIKTKL